LPDEAEGGTRIAFVLRAGVLGQVAAALSAKFHAGDFTGGLPKIRIGVGYGIEDVLPDVFASLIIQEVAIPRLRAGDPDAALTATVGAVRGRPLRTIGAASLYGLLVRTSISARKWATETVLTNKKYTALTSWEGSEAKHPPAGRRPVRVE
jgi:hypothetical protein